MNDYHDARIAEHERIAKAYEAAALKLFGFRRAEAENKADQHKLRANQLRQQKSQWIDREDLDRRM